MTIMDLLDTTVKIGLGALISGATTYWVTTSKNRHEIYYELIRRRLGFLEQSAEQAELFYHDYLKYSGKVIEHFRGDTTADNFPEDYRSSLKENYNKVIETSAQFSNALSKLLLVGEKESYSAARELGMSISDFMLKTFETREPISESEINKQKDEIRKKREVFLEKLSVAFKHETT